MAEPTDFFTAGSLMTFGGATLATFIVPNAFQAAMNFNPRWLGFVVAQVICIGVVATGDPSGGSGGLIDYVVAVINGCLVYCSAIGATSVGWNATAGRRRDAARRIPDSSKSGDRQNKSGPIPKSKPLPSPPPEVPPQPEAARTFLTPWY